MIKISKNKICEGCQYDHYPLCYGTKMFDGNYMNIENLKKDFECGQKNLPNLKDFSIKRKTKLELRIEELEERIKKLESK